MRNVDERLGGWLSYSQTAVLAGRLLPFPGLRWGSVWLAPERVAGGFARAGLEEKIEHARVGGPDGQGRDRVAGPGLAQLPQQRADGPRVVEAGVAGGVAGQQGWDRVAGPGLAQRPQQQATAPGRRGGVAAVAGQQGSDRVAGPGLAQRPQQRGDGPRVVEAGVAGGPGGQGGDRVAGPGLAQRPQQRGDGLRVVEAGVAGGPGWPGR